jgi:hypothetical protein
METSLRCQVSPGMFSGEVAVRCVAADGAEFSLFVSDDFVEFGAPVGESRPVEGWLRVEAVEREGDLLLVRLPGQAFENGQMITVRDSQLESRPRREAV